MLINDVSKFNGVMIEIYQTCPSQRTVKIEECRAAAFQYLQAQERLVNTLDTGGLPKDPDAREGHILRSFQISESAEEKLFNTLKQNGLEIRFTRGNSIINSSVFSRV